MRHRYLVAYDIREPGRLRRVHTTMQAYGEPLQYSVFLCDLSPAERISMKRDLGEAIDHWDDRVAIVDLGDSSSRGMECFEFLGQQGRLPSAGPRIL